MDWKGRIEWEREKAARDSVSLSIKQDARQRGQGINAQFATANPAAARNVSD
jgi:hypothetical protein